jgi:uncharacterized protein (TIGR02246 family)
MRIIDRSLLALSAVMLEWTLLGQAVQGAQPDPTILKVAEQYRQAVLAGDAAAAARTYRQDAIEMAPGRPALKGRAAIEQYYRELFTGPFKVSEFRFTYLETSVVGDTGYLAGTYLEKLAGGPARFIEDSGKFVVIVKRDSGTWGSAYTIYNSDHSASVNCASSLPVPFPQHDLALLVTDGIDGAYRWLLRFGMVVLAATILLAPLLTGVRLSSLRAQNASSRSPSRTISAT